MNKAKRKLLISVLVMMFILISVVATVAIIFAATQQTITTTLNMTYTAENIYGSVKGSYSLGGVTENLTASTGGTDLVFQGKPLQNGALSFPTEQLDMSSEASELILKYDFTNSGRRHYIATMSFESIIEPYNMKVQYSIDGDVYSDQRYAVVVQDDTTRSYWIKISVENKADNASFKGDFIWNLEDTEDMDEATYLSLSSLEFQGSDGTYSASISEAGDFVGAITFPSEVNGDEVTTISASSLSAEDKAKVTSVYIPDSVTTIGDSAFSGYSNLETVTFEQNEAAGSSSVSAQSTTGLKTIGDNAFKNCTNLRELILPNTVSNIGYYTILGCASLEEFVVPDGVTSFDVRMYSCVSLKSFKIGKNVSWIVDDTCIFDNSPSLESLTVHEDNTTYHSAGNCIIKTATKTLAVGCKTSIIPTDGSVTALGSFAFYGCKSLINIKIPNTVTEIGSFVFNSCTSLTTMEMPDTITTIGTGAFSYCTSLKEITIPNTVINIDNEAFAYCTSLTDVTLSNSITKIVDCVFCGCSELTSITIPSSVETIYCSAFLNCEKLTSVIFENKIGWKAGSTTITEEQLTDPENAATLFKETCYADYDWTRSK